MIPRWISPTQRTQRLAVRMLRSARASSGAEAVIEHYEDLEPEQLLALVGVLLTRAVRANPTDDPWVGRVGPKKGRPVLPLTLTPEQRLEGRRQFNAGIDTPFTRQAVREYRRARQRARRRELQETG